MNRESERKLMRRVAGGHDIRLDGILDLVIRAKEARVFDVGCNRGLVAYEFANNGAILCHGCDNYAEGIQFSRELFADLRNCESKFEVVDLTERDALRVFGQQRYDITLLLATYHKLKRAMDASRLSALMTELGQRTVKWFAWRGTSEKANENEGEIIQLDRDMKAAGLKRIHTSYISQTLGVACIWERQ
jgi:SAM-dependent methyltransferase